MNRQERADRHEPLPLTYWELVELFDAMSDSHAQAMRMHLAATDRRARRNWRGIVKTRRALLDRVDAALRERTK